MCVYAASYSVTQAFLLCLVCYACGGGGEPRLDTYPRATQGLPSAVTGEEDPHNTHLQSKEFLDEKERLAVEEGPLAGLCSLERPAVLPSTGSSLELRAPWQRRWPPKTESFVKNRPCYCGESIRERWGRKLAFPCTCGRSAPHRWDCGQGKLSSGFSKAQAELPHEAQSRSEAGI